MNNSVESEAVSLDETPTTKTVNALNELILNELSFDEKQIIKVLRFKQWLLDQNN